MKNITFILVLISVLLVTGMDKTHAQNGIGGMLQQGLNAERMGKYSEAFQSFLMFAEAGDPEGQYHVGYYYLSGLGVSINDAQAVYWFHKGAEQGNKRCEYQLANCYEKGWGVPKDPDMAGKLYDLASQQGTNNASPFSSAIGTSEGPDVISDWVNQGKAALGTKEYSKAYVLFQKAANAGNVDGELLLGGCYLVGAGTKRNPTTAVKWFRKAADTGNPKGEGMLGALYEKGLGVNKDLNKAREYFQKAADQGDEVAKKALANMDDD